MQKIADTFKQETPVNLFVISCDLGAIATKFWFSSFIDNMIVDTVIARELSKVEMSKKTLPLQNSVINWPHCVCLSKNFI